MIHFKEKEVERTYFSVIMSWVYTGYKNDSVTQATDNLRSAIEYIENDKSDLYFDEIITSGLCSIASGNYTYTVTRPYLIIRRNYWDDMFKSEYEKNLYKKRTNLIISKV